MTTPTAPRLDRLRRLAAGLDGWHAEDHAIGPVDGVTDTDAVLWTHELADGRTLGVSVAYGRHEDTGRWGVLTIDGRRGAAILIVDAPARTTTFVVPTYATVEALIADPAAFAASHLTPTQEPQP